MSVVEQRALIVECDGPTCEVRDVQHYSEHSSVDARLPEGWYCLSAASSPLVGRSSWYHTLACLADAIAALDVVRGGRPPNERTQLREFWHSVRSPRERSQGCRVHGVGCEYSHATAEEAAR